MVATIELLREYHQEISQAPRVVVGYSGGLDSSVLLASVVELLPPERVFVVHINHQINDASDVWEEHCRTHAEALGVPFYSEKVSVDPESALEEQAREARYRVFERVLGERELLLLGHHADDQVETFLFRLFRGSGVKGLSAIPPMRQLGRGKILRPLLGYSKQELQDWASHRGMDWIEDPSNSDSQFDRNFIRNELMLLIKDRWTEADQQLLHAVDVLRDTDQLLSEIADEDLENADMRRESVGVSIEVGAVKLLSQLRQENLLRRFIYLQLGTQPNRQTLQVVREEIIDAVADAQPCVRQSTIEIRRFKSRLYLTPLFPNNDCLQNLPADWPLDARVYELPNVWKIEKVGDWQANLRLDVRRGGERLKPLARDRSQSLKKLMQEYDIEPWLRDWMPVIYLGDEIVAVGDRIHCSDFRFQMHWLIEQPV